MSLMMPNAIIGTDFYIKRHTHDRFLYYQIAYFQVV